MDTGWQCAALLRTAIFCDLVGHIFFGSRVADLMHTRTTRVCSPLLRCERSPDRAKPLPHQRMLSGFFKPNRFSLLALCVAIRFPENHANAQENQEKDDQESGNESDGMGQPQMGDLPAQGVSSGKAG